MRRTNLIPADLAVHSRFTFKTQFDYLLFLSAVVMFTFFLLILIFQLIGIGFFTFQGKIQARKVASITGALSENKRIKKNLAGQIEGWQEKAALAKERVVYLKEAMEQDILWSRVLEKLNSFVPARLWMKKLSLDKKLITIKGNAYNNLLISTFMSNLSNSNFFTNVNLSYIKKTKAKTSKKDEAKVGGDREVIEFEIACRILDSGIGDIESKSE